MRIKQNEYKDRHQYQFSSHTFSSLSDSSFCCVSPVASRNQARGNDEADVIGTRFGFLEITRSNRGSQLVQRVGRGTRVT